MSSRLGAPQRCFAAPAVQGDLGAEVAQLSSCKSTAGDIEIFHILKMRGQL